MKIATEADQLYSLHHAFTHLPNVLGALQHTNVVEYHSYNYEP